MSDAPEMIWANRAPDEDHGMWWVAGSRPRLRLQDVEYRRADIPWLPEELVERAGNVLKAWNGTIDLYTSADVAGVLRDILAACDRDPDELRAPG